MDHLVLVHVRFGEARSDPQSLTSRSIRNVTDFAGDVDVTLADTVQHWKNRALPRDVDDRAFPALPHYVRRTLTAHQQPVPSDLLEAHADRHALVSVRVVTG